VTMVYRCRGLPDLRLPLIRTRTSPTRLILPSFWLDFYHAILSCAYLSGAFILAALSARLHKFPSTLPGQERLFLGAELRKA
jgi:hypothetical protein